jgi:diguanylate cyclase (GGDEF)-like protein
MQMTDPNIIVTGLESIIDAAAGVLAAKSLDATLQGMVGELDRIVPFTSLALYEADHDARILVPVFAVGQYVEETLADRPTFDDSIAGAVVTSGLMAHYAPTDPRLRNYTIPDTPEEEPAAIVVVPLLVGDEAIGTLTVWREGENPAPFSTDDARLIRRFATLAALAYANARQRDQLSRLALTDDLTGLANRRHFQTRLGAELARTRRDGTPVALVLLDLDDFKAVNDHHGHPAGDVALRAFADVLRAHVRASDVPCRTGGEEFAVILPATELDEAVASAERLLAATRAAKLGPDGVTTASAGVTAAPAEATSEDELFRIADDRLLLAKKAGKDRVVAG